MDIEQHWLKNPNVRTVSGEPLRLIAQPTKLRRARPRSRNALYDIAVCNGELPTRQNNWHDFFNVLMFAAYPASKRQLHARHRRILEARLPNEIERLPGQRTLEQDCLTILDEGGVLLAIDSDATGEVEVLLDRGNHDGLAKLVGAGSVRPWLFGHAHAEQIVKRAILSHLTPTPSLSRAKPVLLSIGANANRAAVDAALAHQLSHPNCCTERDARKAIALEDLFLDLRNVE